MIYCNIRKEHIKPEVGQLWATRKGHINIEIIAIIQSSKYPIVGYGSNGIYEESVRYGLSGERDPSFDGYHNPYKGLYRLIEEAPKPPSPWQPIETAPKDGTRIFAFGKPKEAGFEPYRTIIRYWQKYEIECDHYWEGGLKGDEPLLELNEYDGFHYFTENWYEESNCE